MQETIPELEEELENLVSKFVENATRARAPAMGSISRHRIFEGKQSVIIRPDGEENETKFHAFSADSEIPSKTLLYSSLNEILECFIPVAEAMAKDHEKMFFETMDEVTKKTGNIVHGGGQPLSHEKILEVLEVIQIDFDSDGSPIMPTMIISPAMEPRLKELMNDPSAKEFEAKQNAIIERKRLEWRDREANRTLVG